MPGTGAQEVSDVTASVAKANTVMKSAQALIEGFKALLDDAVAAANANGATLEELQPLVDLSKDVDAESDALQAAVVANTPAKPA